MEIYLLDIDEHMTDCWVRYFGNEDIKIYNIDFATFMKNYPDMQCIVSPANSFGLMDGGYDKAITDYFGDDLQKQIQKEIIEKYNGLQPVGTAHLSKINDNQYLMHVPSMIYPSKVLDTRIIYQCMRVVLQCAKDNKVDQMVIPAFGAATGAVSHEEVARMMWLAYSHWMNPPTELNWKYACGIRNDLSGKVTEE